MPWSTERVVPETEMRAGRLGVKIARLPQWHDVDTAADLNRLVRNLTGAGCAAAQAPRTALFCQGELARHVVVG
jgi:glycosyltransferase A (GT-A) superfamily protein (DUF2064 family)